MLEKEFFKGELVLVKKVEEFYAKLNKPETISECYVGTIKCANTILEDLTYVIKLSSGEEIEFKKKAYDVERVNEHEVGKDFEKTLRGELELIADLTKEKDVTKRAATLATLRNLTRYLSKEIDKEYKLIEDEAINSDITGRAATLSTLRNLRKYHENRK